MTIQQVHNIIFLLIRKEQNVFATHGDVDTLLDFYQMGIFSKFTGSPEEQVGVLPMMKSGYGQTQYFDDAMTPFKNTVQFLYEDTPGGLITLPTNYERLTGIYSVTTNNKTDQVKHNKITILSEDQMSDRLDSEILPPSISKPVGVFLGQTGSQYQIQLYPKQPMAGVYSYFSRPVPPFYSYTMNGRQETYNPSTSKSMQWNDEIQVQIIMSTLQGLGINIGDNTLIQLSQMKQLGGVVS